MLCFILFIYSRAFNNNVISNGKSYCCNDTFIFVPLTSLLSKNIFKKYKLLLCCYNQHFISYFVWNFHSNWLFFLRVMQGNKSGHFFLNSVIWAYRTQKKPEHLNLTKPNYLGMLIPGYLDTRVPCGLPGSRETSDLPSYRDRYWALTALTARVATYRLNCWLQLKAWSGPCVNSLLIIIAHAAR